MPDRFLYLFLNGITILFPLLWSFEGRVRFASKWKALFPALLVPAAIFIAWDVLYTHWSVWGFNPRYLTGIDIFKLPLEEVLFFFCIPYACVFIYEVVRIWWQKDPFRTQKFRIAIALASILALLGLLHIDKLYTSVTFLGLSALLFFLVFGRRASWLGSFFFAYLIVLIPFFLINGVLTGAGIEEEIVRYDDSENLGIRIYTIPVEDAFYGMLLILMNVSIFEGILDRDKG
jgi:lycopene cyclase domain-containing protein